MLARFIYMLVCFDLFSYFNTLKRGKFHSPPVGERSPSVGKFLAPPLLSATHTGNGLKFIMTIIQAQW